MPIYFNKEKGWDYSQVTDEEKEEILNMGKLALLVGIASAMTNADLNFLKNIKPESFYNA